jgi:hypothetical protein
MSATTKPERSPMLSKRAFRADGCRPDIHPSGTLSKKPRAFSGDYLHADLSDPGNYQYQERRIIPTRSFPAAWMSGRKRLCLHPILHLLCGLLCAP